MAFKSTDYLLDDHPRTLFPLDLTRIVVEHGAPRLFQYIAEDIKPSEKKGKTFAPQLRCFSAKHGLHLRRTLKLDPVAELYIYDLVLPNRKFFKSDTRKTRRQYGYCFKGGKPISAMAGYREFKHDLLHAEKAHEHGLRLDVATYFNSVYHHDVVNYFDNLGWNDDDTCGLNRFLGEINGTSSIDCLPQGLHPCKVLGASFLHIIDKSARLRSELVLRFLDDIHLFSDDEVKIGADFGHIQHVLGEKGLSLNSEKTRIIAGAGHDLEKKIDEIKAGLLKIRRYTIEVSGERGQRETQEIVEFDNLSDEHTDYLLELLRDPNLEEADAELVLTLLSEHGEEVLDRMASVWPKYPSLSKPIYNFVTQEFSDSMSVLAMADAFLNNAPNATEFQLFWLIKVLQVAVARDERFGNTVMHIYAHPNASVLVQAKVLEMADNGFGMAELREEILKRGQSDWPSWAAAIGCRVQSKASRNKLINNCGGVSPLNRVIADIAMALDVAAPEKPKMMALPF
jgi:hypothetical protein